MQSGLPAVMDFTLNQKPSPEKLNPNCQPHTVIIPSIKIIMVILFRFNLFLNKS